MRPLSSKLLAVVIASTMLTVMFAAFVSAPVSATTPPPAFLDGFMYRKMHDILPSAGAGAGYAVGIKVYNGTGTDGVETVDGVEMGKVYLGATAQGDFDDIRFTGDDAQTILPCWRESYTLDDNAVFWVNLFYDVSTVTQSIYVYWGYPLAVEPSCGETTFQFFDHFNNSYWQKQGVIIPIPATDWHFTEPTVLYETGRHLLTGTGEVFKLWYRAQHADMGTYLGYIRYAESEDGWNWVETTIMTADPDVTGNHLALPFVCHVGSYYYLYIHGHLLTACDVWRSSNGVTGWTLLRANTLVSDASPAWDSLIIGNSFVWYESGTWYMTYDANSVVAHEQWQTGLATSPDGMTWTKYVGNPIIGNASYFAGGFHVQKVGSTYYAWGQATRDPDGYLDNFDRWQSTDLHSWTRAAGWEWTIPRELPTEAWEICDPSMIYAKGNIWIYYLAASSPGNWNGISLALVGMPFDQLVQTQENQAYNKTLKWTSAAIAQMTVVDSWATITGLTGWEQMETIKQDFGPGINVRTDGAYSTSPSAGTGSRVCLNNEHYPTGVTLQVATVYVNSANQIGVFDGSATTVTTDISGGVAKWDLKWIVGSVSLFRDGVEALNSPVTTNVPTNSDMTLVYDALNATATFTLNSTFVRPYVASEPEHDVWCALEIYGVTPPPTPGPAGNYGDMAWIFIFLAMGAIFLGFIVKKSEELK
jgi:hypothetical protein